MESSIIGGTTKQSTKESEYPPYYYKPRDNIFDVTRKTTDNSPFHLTQPNEGIAKALFLNNPSPPKRKGKDQES